MPSIWERPKNHAFDLKPTTSIVTFLWEKNLRYWSFKDDFSRLWPNRTHNFRVGMIVFFSVTVEEILRWQNHIFFWKLGNVWKRGFLKIVQFWTICNFQNKLLTVFSIQNCKVLIIPKYNWFHEKFKFKLICFFVKFLYLRHWNRIS